MITAHDIDTLARTIWGEARGEDEKGRMLVAQVILNRWRTGYRGKKNIADVCQDPWQFSCWNGVDVNRAKIMRVDMNDKSFRECFRIAIEAIDAPKRLPPTTRHYYATSMLAPPKWAVGHEPVLEHGHHKFYDGIA